MKNPEDEPFEPYADLRRQLHKDLWAEALRLTSDIDNDVRRPTRSLTPSINLLLGALTNLVRANAHRAWEPKAEDAAADAELVQRLTDTRLESALAQVRALKAQLATERASADEIADREFEGQVIRERALLQEQRAFLVSCGMKTAELEAMVSSCREQARQRLMQVALARIDKLLGTP